MDDDVWNYVNHIELPQRRGSLRNAPRAKSGSTPTHPVNVEMLMRYRWSERLQFAGGQVPTGPLSWDATSGRHQVRDEAGGWERKTLHFA